MVNPISWLVMKILPIWIKVTINDPGHKKRNRSMKKRLCTIVTGATGLLGTNVILKLLQNGYSVTALVRQKAGWAQKTKI